MVNSAGHSDYTSFLPRAFLLSPVFLSKHFFMMHFLLPLLATAPLAWASSHHKNSHARFGKVPGQDFGIPGQNATFDYIVVGGGTGGLAIASRLAESGQHSVAVIEAGGFYEQESGNTSVVPAYSVKYDGQAAEDAHQYPLVDWGIVTEPEEGLGGRKLHYARGKTLGGSSAFHGMVYNRGTIGSYQAWADLVGDNSWTFDNLLPFFTRGIEYHNESSPARAANASFPPPANPLAVNATGGPLQLSIPVFAQTFSSYVNGAMAESGIPEQQDFISGNLLGRQYAITTISYPEAERSSSESSYLRSALQSDRDNLKVYVHTLAKRVLFDGDKTAIGVELEAGSYANSAPFTLQARKEVILSAGVFQSPQLLMVSGIGPRAQLEAHNITVLADRPGVGTDMQDHLDMSITYYTNVQGGYSAIADPSANGPLIQEYIVNRTGPLTAPNVDYIGWDKLPEPYRSNLSATALRDLAQFPADWPEIEYEITGATLAGADPSKRYGSIVAVPVSPLSRGWVNITSNSTHDLPVVNPNQLSHPTDRELALQAFKRARAMFKTEAIQPVIMGEFMPGTNVTSDEQIMEYIETTSFQNWHASCTCRMGKSNDSMAVVDSQARVIGVHGLRVVDASSFALLPPGHPQSTIYVMAEKIAADILGTA